MTGTTDAGVPFTDVDIRFSGCLEFCGTDIVDVSRIEDVESVEDLGDLVGLNGRNLQREIIESCLLTHRSQ